MTEFKRGDIWLYNPGNIRGREQGNVRPAVIVSNEEFNRTSRGLVVVVPISRTRRQEEIYPMHVELSPDVSGLSDTSYAICERIRAISIERLRGNAPRGALDDSVMRVIETRLRSLLLLE